MVLVSALVNVTAVQNFLVRRITATLSGKLHTEVSIRHVDFRLFNKFTLEGTYIGDQHRDTLLYADKLTVNVTNFFFLKPKTYLWYVGLDHAKVNLRRLPGDSTWNYQFILDELASPDTTSGGAAAPPNLDIRKVVFNDVRVYKRDGWEGQDMQASLDHMVLDARNIDLRKRRILINSLTLTHPLFALVNYTRTRPRDSTVAPSPPPAKTDTVTGGLRWNTDHWTLQVNNIRITDGGFALIDQEESSVDANFDPQHMVFYDVDATLKNTHLVQDSLITDLALSTRERSGLEVRQLTCRFKISPVEMEFRNLDLRTNRSHLTDYYQMQFTDFSDLGDFVTKVRLHADFKQATISSDDIAFFAPALSSWKMNIAVSGNVYGPIANLTGEDMNIRASGSTELSGEIRMRGLPDIQNTFIDFQAEKLKTTGKDIQQFVPSLRGQAGINLDKLTAISFSGNYTGFIEDFVAYGDFKTNLGNVHSDLNMKFGARHQVPVYSGRISAQDFNLGTLLSDSVLGPVTFSAKVDGSGFNLNELNAKVDAQVDELFVNDYTYHHILTQGTFDKKLFNGLLEVADSNLALNFTGSVDFNQSLPVFHFRSDVAKSDLRSLNLTRDSITFSGKLDMNFTGNDIDNFMGDARLYDINLYKSKTRVAFDTLVVHSRMDSAGEKLLTVQGNEIQGFLKGDYNLHDLPAAVKHFASRYFPSMFEPPRDSLFRENFVFGFQLGNADKLLPYFMKGISGLDNSKVSGSMNTLSDTLSLEADIPGLGYDKYQFNDIGLHIGGKAQGLGMQTSVGEVLVQDSLLLPSLDLKTVSNSDTTYINVKTAGAAALNNADLYARVISLKDGYNVKILNSELSVNDKTWTIAPDNEITLRKNGVTVHNFNIAHNDQKITLTSHRSDSVASSFLVRLQHLYIADFAQFFFTSPTLEGIADGTIVVDNPLGNLQATANVNMTQLRINNDSLGTVHTQVAYDKLEAALDWHVYKDDNPLRDFSMQGKTGLNKTNQLLQGDFQLNHTDLGLLGSFIKDYVSEFSGYGTGTLKLGGSTAAPEITGSVTLDSVGMKVNYLGTYYTLTGETVNFTPGNIDLGSITLHDTYGHTAVLQGKITHHHFNDLNFDVSLNTQAFELMHTNVLDNPVYYGHAIASGRVNLTGPLQNMKMTVNISPLEGTHIYLPLSDAKDIGKHDFVIFKQYGKELKQVRPVNQKANLSVKLYANMNPQAAIDVIVDAASGDRISASGNGSLQMNMDLEGNFKMYGNYTIDHGNYIFSFKGLLSRNFLINQGSTISWNGDPTNANVDITAIYDVPGGASLYDLVGDDENNTANLTKEDTKLMRQREKVEVYLMLKGSLGHPDISYDIRLPDAGINTGSYAITKLQQIKQNPNDLINQVAALLAFGQFIPNTSSTANNDLFRSGGLSSAGQWVSSQLSGVLNNLLGSTLRKLGVDFSLNYNAYSASGSNRNDVQFNLTKSIFNNRVRIEVGPSLDWGRSANQQASNSSYFAGDFRFEYLVTPDGRIRFMAFSRSNYDVLLNTNLTRGGVGISYNREFNRLHELFLTRQEKLRRDSLRTQVINRYMQTTQQDSLPVTDSAKAVMPEKKTKRSAKRRAVEADTGVD